MKKFTNKSVGLNESNIENKMSHKCYLIFQREDVAVEALGEALDDLREGVLLLQDGEPLRIENILPHLAHRSSNRILKRIFQNFRQDLKH